MEYARIGRTGLEVSRICLGTNMFGADYVEDSRALSVVDQAIDQGINFIDTADLYNDGKSEEVVGKAVKGRRDMFVIGTKGFAPTGPGVNDKGLSRKHVIEAVEGSLQRLGTDYIDLYQVHWWDPNTPVEETLRTLDNLVRQGKIRYIGCSNFAAWQLTKALWASDNLGLERFESIQPLYNLGERGIEKEVLPLCQDQDLSVIPYQVLMGGILSGAYDRSSGPPEGTHMASRHASGARGRYWNDASFDVVERLKDIAADVSCEPAQLVMAWVLSKPAVASVIIGSSRPEQIVKNAKAADIKLSQDVLEEMDSF